jgi:hypothetical protein
METLNKYTTGLGSVYGVALNMAHVEGCPI